MPTLDQPAVQPVKYFLAILLPPALAQWVDGWRQAWYPYGIKSVPPHITIVPPFTPSVEEKSLITKIEQLVKGANRFKLHVNGFSQFNKQSIVVYAKVIDTPDLHQMQAQLIKGIACCANEKIIATTGYVPHITLANGLTVDEALVLKQQLQQEGVDESIEVRAVSLLRKIPGQPYDPVHQFNLA